MKVYLVFDRDYYNNTILIGVFQNEEKALQRIKEKITETPGWVKNENKNEWDNFALESILTIEEWNVE